jgi:hypothetical protein
MSIPISAETVYINGWRENWKFWAQSLTNLYYILFLNTFFCIGVWTQGFMLEKQVLYLLNYTSSPFCSGCFGDAWAGLEPQTSWSQFPK